MKKAAGGLNFEEAGVLRDTINSIIAISSRQVSVLKNLKDIDVIGFYREKDAAGITVILIRGGKITGTNNFFLKNVLIEDSEMASSFLDRYYTKTADIYGRIPDEILIPSSAGINISDREILSGYIRQAYNKKIKIKEMPDSSGLIGMARENAKKNFFEKTAAGNVSDAKTRALAALKEKLGLKEISASMECFDISNISGSYPVASKAVLRDGVKDVSSYRRYKIVTKNTPDDYAMMREALFRRFNNAVSGKDPLPDAIMVDGGKGQLNVLVKVAREFVEKGLLSRETMPALIAIAKAKDKREEMDAVYVPNRKNPLNFGRNKDALFLLMGLRDEAHRFALSYHSKIKRKSLTTSELTGIKGVGKKTYLKLVGALGSVDDIKRASLDDILGVKGVSSKAGRAVYAYFQGRA